MLTINADTAQKTKSYNIYYYYFDRVYSSNHLIYKTIAHEFFITFLYLLKINSLQSK